MKKAALIALKTALIVLALFVLLFIFPTIKFQWQTRMT